MDTNKLNWTLDLVDTNGLDRVYLWRLHCMYNLLMYCFNQFAVDCFKYNHQVRVILLSSRILVIDFVHLLEFTSYNKLIIFKSIHIPMSNLVVRMHLLTFFCDVMHFERTLTRSFNFIRQRFHPPIF